MKWSVKNQQNIFNSTLIQKNKTLRNPMSKIKPSLTSNT